MTYPVPTVFPPSEASVPILLGRQTGQPQMRLAARSLDFQTRVGRPSSTYEGQAQPCVFVFTHSSDAGMDDLSLRLAAEAVPMVRADSDLSTGAISWDDVSAVLTYGRERFSPVVTWLRYFSVTSLPLSGDAVLDAYCRTQWAAWMGAVVSLRRARLLNGGAGPGQPDRLSQLAAAEAAGLRVPHTVVTNDLAAAAVTIPGDGDLIVKSLGEHCLETTPGCMHGLFPRRVARKEAARARTLEPAPVMVQAYVESQRELRVFVIGGDVVGFEVSKPSADAFWRDPGSIDVELCTVPAHLQARLVELARYWRLDVVGFDVLDTLVPAGGGRMASEIFFLEANAICDWLFFERSAGTRTVSELVSQLVVQAYREALSRSSCGGIR